MSEVALQVVGCPGKCKEPIGRIIFGQSEFACRKDRLRVHVECVEVGGEVRVIRVDKLPPRRPKSA